VYYWLLALTVTFGIACWALVRSYLPPPSIKNLRRAFEALEEEFEDQRDHVRSALGRVSRLKRSMMAGEVPQENPGDDETNSVPALVSTSPGLTPRQQAIQAKILSRRKHGGIQ